MSEHINMTVSHYVFTFPCLLADLGSLQLERRISQEHNSLNKGRVREVVRDPLGEVPAVGDVLPPGAVQLDGVGCLGRRQVLRGCVAGDVRAMLG